MSARVDSPYSQPGQVPQVPQPVLVQATEGDEMSAWLTVLTLTLVLLMAMGAAELLSEYLAPAQTAIGTAWTQAPR